MANFTFTEALEELPKGTIDYASGGDDIRVMLVMSNTTADVQGAGGVDAATISAFTDPDEYDGANYVRKALANETVTKDSTNDKGVFDADDVTWAALGVGTRQAQAAVIYKHVTNDADSIPLHYVDTGGFPFSGNGSDVTLQFAAAGVVLFQNP